MSTPDITHASTSGQRARGSAVQSTLGFLEAQFGVGVARRVVTTLAVTDRQAIAAVTPTDEVPYALLVRLWNAADVLLDKEQVEQRRGWAERAGEASIGSFGVQLYGGILRKPTPHEFLTQSISLFRLFYQPGDISEVEEAPGRAVLRLVGFDPATPVFCRRQTGGLRQAIALAGGGAPQVEHVRCTLEGDAFCEWELTWAVDTGTAGARPSP